MAVEPNLIKTPDMGDVDAIDFVNQFAYSIQKLQEALGITRPQPMRQGNKIQTYKFDLKKPDGDAAKGIVAEGEDIPLTHVSRAKDREFEVGFRKYRKAVTIEEVQRVGYDMAANQTDTQVRQAIQKDIRSDFFTYLGTAPTDLGTVSGLQEAFGKSWGKLGSLFDNEDVGTIVFINPEDAGEYLGGAVIENGQSVGFGMTLLTSFTNVRVIINNSVPKGTFYSTVQNNINLQYIDVNGEASKIFHNKQITTDETGLIALVKDDNTVNLTDQSTIYLGMALFAEVTDGVLKGTLAKKA
ncbi:phage capsid protein [Agrilactobacillus fermenti]|uniref:phage capsid protein n=1 Tax=Agrilactobacillus fermenti TaxID=2586909 RepID=UPI001E298818|nr:phage capsid protein [Agrilactobacillus fermenti]MCD2256416.1 hypothetical protein [Agrilactobacillus fermenti]